MDYFIFIYLFISVLQIFLYKYIVRYSPQKSRNASFDFFCALAKPMIEAEFLRAKIVFSILLQINTRVPKLRDWNFRIGISPICFSSFHLSSKRNDNFNNLIYIYFPYWELLIIFVQNFET